MADTTDQHARDMAKDARTKAEAAADAARDAASKSHTTNEIFIRHEAQCKEFRADVKTRLDAQTVKIEGQAEIFRDGLKGVHRRFDDLILSMSQSKTADDKETSRDIQTDWRGIAMKGLISALLLSTGGLGTVLWSIISKGN